MSSSDILHRTYSGLDLEIRRNGDGRTVYGLCVPFDSVERVTDLTRSGPVTYDEVWRMGAFADTIRERGDRVKFLVNHDRETLPIGRAVMLREDPAGLVGEFKVSRTTAGEEALELIRDGALDGLSIGAKPIESNGDRNDGGLVERTVAKLLEVSAVAFPAYDAALIEGVRTAAPDQGSNIIIVPDQDEAPDQGNPALAADPTLAARRRLRLELRRDTQ